MHDDPREPRINEQEYREGYQAYPGKLPVMTHSHLQGWQAAKDQAALDQQIQRQSAFDRS